MKTLLTASSLLVLWGHAPAAPSSANGSPLAPPLPTASHVQAPIPAPPRPAGARHATVQAPESPGQGRQTQVVPASLSSATPAPPPKPMSDSFDHYASPAHAELHHLKLLGQPIPASLLREVFGDPPKEGPAPRTGGETWATAVQIPFTAGGQFVDVGSTIGFANDIPTGQAPPQTCNTSFYPNFSFAGSDAVYSFTLPFMVEVSASVCGTTSYDSCLGIFDAAHALVAVNDDSPGCSNFSSRILPCCLGPGTYFIVVDSYSMAAGSYTLTVDFGAAPCGNVDPCADPITVACGGSVAGTTVGGVNHVGEPAPDVFHQVVISQDGPVIFSLCGGGTTYDSMLLLYSDCPTDGGDLLAWNDDACGTQSEIGTYLAAGTYWLVVEGYNTNAGPYSLSVNCGSCAPVACTGVPESEPNDGPNGDPVAFDTIECGALSTVCGTVWADGGFRDTDWYLLDLEESSTLAIGSEAGLFDPLVFILDAEFNEVEVAEDNDFCEGESLQSDCLAPGTYYLWMGHATFDGVPEEQAYAMTLDCTPCGASPCDGALPIACNQIVTGSSAQSSGNVWETYCNGGEDGPELVYTYEHAGGFMSLTLSGSTDEDLDLVLLGSCNPLDCLSMPFAVGSQETISGTYPAGSYIIVVDAWNYTGGAFTFTLSVSCGEDPCADLPPVDCQGTPELEPNEGWYADPPNGNFDEIACGGTVCGTVWASGGGHDLDWFHFSHDGGDLRFDSQIGAFDAVLYLMDFAVGTTSLASSNGGIWCVPESLVMPALPAGEYFIVIGHNGFEGVDEEEAYALTMSCTPDPCDGHEPIACAGTPESEPNEGWNDNNASHGQIADGETVCGSIWADGGDRDLDWFAFTVEETVNVRIDCLVDWFNPLLFLTTYTDDSQGGFVYAASDATGACTGEVILFECLGPGEYYAVITHALFDGVPEEQNYSMTLGFEPCTPVDPCADLVQGGVLAQSYTVSRPAPVANHHNAANGCAGISSSGFDELHQLTLSAATSLRVTMQGAGLADEVIYILTDCQSTQSCVAGRDANPPDPGAETMIVNNLPAGVYFIAADYWSSGESMAYDLGVFDLATGVGDRRPPSFSLEPNHPNPFNPATTISWIQPELLPVTLFIHNLAGERVQEFDLGFRGASRHAITWNAAGLPSGVYFTTLSAGGRNATGKVLLLK